MLISKFRLLAAVTVLPSLANVWAAPESDPYAVLVRENEAEAVAEGDNIVEEASEDEVDENVASRYVLAHISIIQGLTERLSGELVAAVPDEVAENLRDVLTEARSLEQMAIDVGAGEYDEVMAEVAGDPEVRKLMGRLDVITARLEEKNYYNSPELEEVVSEILNILSDL